jgi:hypothetical protein
VHLGRLDGAGGLLLLVLVLVPLALVRATRGLDKAPVALLVADLPRLGVAASDLLQDAASLLPRRSTQVRGRSPLPVVLSDCMAAADE